MNKKEIINKIKKSNYNKQYKKNFLKVVKIALKTNNLKKIARLETKAEQLKNVALMWQLDYILNNKLIERTLKQC